MIQPAEDVKLEVFYRWFRLYKEAVAFCLELSQFSSSSNLLVKKWRIVNLVIATEEILFQPVLIKCTTSVPFKTTVEFIKSVKR